jgi:tRNA A37 N6-isopentenylltransferase MiaA
MILTILEDLKNGLQEEYEKAINNLTINEENRLKRTVEILKLTNHNLKQYQKMLHF